MNDLRSKLTQHVATISAYLDTVGVGALGRIERDVHCLPEQIRRTIDDLAADIRAGLRESSVMTTYEDDEKHVWRQFRRELISDGIRSSAIHEYKPIIRRYLRELAEKGGLEEFAPEEQPQEAEGVDHLLSIEEDQRSQASDNGNLQAPQVDSGHHGLADEEQRTTVQAKPDNNAIRAVSIRDAYSSSELSSPSPSDLGTTKQNFLAEAEYEHEERPIAVDCDNRMSKDTENSSIDEWTSDLTGLSKTISFHQGEVLASSLQDSYSGAHYKFLLPDTSEYYEILWKYDRVSIVVVLENLQQRLKVA